jgi:hypothetical protein
MSSATGLNPIENMWTWMKSQLKDSKATNHGEMEKEHPEALETEDGRLPVSEKFGCVFAIDKGRWQTVRYTSLM